MLDIVSRPFRNCDRASRREVLRVGALAFGGATLAGFLRTKAHAAVQGRDFKDTAVIQIFMGGGPSHIDMYDMKPAAPAEFRGEFKPVPTRVPGIRICEHLPLQAAAMDKLAVVRSVTHTNSSHLPSSHLLLTGYEPPSPPNANLHPFAGSVVSKIRGPNQPGLPAYVAVPRAVSFGSAAYLGSAHNPFTTDNEPLAHDFHVPNLTPVAGLSQSRLGHRWQLLRRLDTMRRDLDLRGDLLGLDDFSRQAMDLITGERAARAFDVDREDPKLRDRYGRTSIGQNCLLACRLVEAGVTYVTCLSGGGWDTHVNNFSELKKTLPRYDRAIAALVTDLHDRGLADRVLVMAFGEFGRTPRVNSNAGRDHWPGAMSVLLAGGRLKVGQMVGTTDSTAAYPTAKPFSPHCILATMYHTMGIDYRHTFHDQINRPMPILPAGHPISELL